MLHLYFCPHGMGLWLSSEEMEVRKMDLPLSPAGFLLWGNAHPA